MLLNEMRELFHHRNEARFVGKCKMNLGVHDIEEVIRLGYQLISKLEN